MHITLLLAEYSSLTSSALALEVLDAANRFATPATPPFTLTLASLDGRPVANALGRAMAVDVALDAVQHTDLVLIPGFLLSLIHICTCSCPRETERESGQWPAGCC